MKIEHAFHVAMLLSLTWFGACGPRVAQEPAERRRGAQPVRTTPRRSAVDDRARWIAQTKAYYAKRKLVMYAEGERPGTIELAEETGSRKLGRGKLCCALSAAKVRQGEPFTGEGDPAIKLDAKPQVAFVRSATRGADAKHFFYGPDGKVVARKAVELLSGFLFLKSRYIYFMDCPSHVPVCSFTVIDIVKGVEEGGEAYVGETPVWDRSFERYAYVLREDRKPPKEVRCLPLRSMKERVIGKPRGCDRGAAVTWRSDGQVAFQCRRSDESLLKAVYACPKSSAEPAKK